MRPSDALRTRPAKSRRFQLSCAARSASTLFVAIVSPLLQKLKSGRGGTLARLIAKHPPAASGGFACGDLVTGGGMDLERTDNGVGLKQWLQGFANTVVLLPLITLCVLPFTPKAQR